jgi:outer membrane protein assembly factor BamE
MVMRHIIVSFLVVVSLSSVSCTSQLPSFRPYKMDIQQGNVVTSKMMMQLRPGMTKSQVRFIMGTPLIQDSFHSNRWDYFYQMRKDGKVIEQRRVIMEFEKDALLRVHGDVIPAGTGDPAAEPTTGTEPVSQPEEKKKGLVDKLKFWKKDGTEETPQPQNAPQELVSPASKPADVKPADAENKETPAQDAESKPEPAPVPQPSPALEPDSVTYPLDPGTAEPAPQAPEPAAREEVVPAPQSAPESVAEPPAKSSVKPEPTAEPAATESGPTEADTPRESISPALIPESADAPKPAAPKPAAPKQTGRQLPSEPPAPSAPEAPQEGEPGYFEYMLEKIGF